MTSQIPEGDQPPIRCFLSYAHGDEAVLDVVGEFKRSLEMFAHSARGRRVEVFVDRDAIGWGEDWQEKIREGVSSAMAFMPLLTCRYFERPACREELFAFYNGADELAATDLLLPVAMLGSQFITTDSSNRAIRIVAERQYRDFEDAVIAGPGTPEWRRTMLQLATELVDAVERVEAKFEPSVDLAAGTDSTPPPVNELADDAPGLLELDESLGAKLEDMHSGFEEMVELLGRLNTIFTESSTRLRATTTKGPNNPEILRFASTAKPVTEEFEELGARMERVASEADSEFRQLCDLLTEPGTEQVRATLVESVADVVQLQEVLDAIDEFSPQMRPLEVTSAGIRRSLKPMRRGTNSIRTAVAIVRAWPALLGVPGSDAA